MRKAPALAVVIATAAVVLPLGPTQAEGRTAARAGPQARAFGYTEVRYIRLLGAPGEDLTPTMRFIDPDDGNTDDRTLAEVASASPVAPGATVRVAVEWTSLIPHGDVGRAGWVHDYHFIVQWFPKIAARYKGHWNAHTFHPWSEFFSSDLCDYKVSAANREPRELVGFSEGPGGLTHKEPRQNPEPADRFDAEVTVVRLVEFSDGTRKRETWDGKGRWVRFRYPGGPEVVHAVVDPEGRLALDVNPTNNAWRDEQGLARRAAAKWSARYLFWLQNLLELHSVLG